MIDDYYDNNYVSWHGIYLTEQITYEKVKNWCEANFKEYWFEYSPIRITHNYTEIRYAIVVYSKEDSILVQLTWGIDESYK